MVLNNDTRVMSAKVDSPAAEVVVGVYGCRRGLVVPTVESLLPGPCVRRYSVSACSRIVRDNVFGSPVSEAQPDILWRETQRDRGRPCCPARWAINTPHLATAVVNIYCEGIDLHVRPRGYIAGRNGVRSCRCSSEFDPPIVYCCLGDPLQATVASYDGSG